MASQAEVDLVISTDDTLPQLERDLTAIVRAAEANADDIELEALLDTDASISNLVSQLDDVVAAASAAGDEIAVDAALDQLTSLSNLQSDLAEVIHTAEVRAQEIELEAAIDADIASLNAELAGLVRELEEAAPEIDLQVDVDRDGLGTRAAGRLGSALSALTPSLKAAAIAVGSLQAIGSLPPLLAATAISLEAIAPASALAVSGMITLGLVAGTVKLAMNGVGDAVKSAFDPEVKPEELAKQLEALAPSARKFVVELSSMRKNLKAVQQDVQQNFFRGFDRELKALGSTVLPVVAGALSRTSVQFNQMAIGASRAAQDLAKNGTLGKALDSSVVALGQLGNLPGQIVTSLGQIGAAAGPALERLATAAGAAGDRISEKLTASFESGALEKAISGSIDVLKQLGRIVSNVFGGLGNIIGTVTEQGDGLFFILEKVTKAFKDVTASKGFQQALAALVQTAGVLVDTVLPLITQALEALGPVFVELAGPVQALIQTLGSGLTKVFTALGPVLVSAAVAVGHLVELIIPFVTLAADLIAAILPALIPLFDALGQTFVALLPVVEQFVKNLSAQLMPALTTLATEVLPQVLPPFVELTTKLLPVLADILVKLAPALAELGQAFAEVLVELTPVIVEIVNLTIELVEGLMPILGPLISLILSLATGALSILAQFLTGIVVPALRILVDLLQGDFSSAWNRAGELVSNITQEIQRQVNVMKDAISRNLAEAGRAIVARLREARDGAVEAFNNMVSRLTTLAGGLDDQIRSALGDLGSLLVSAGQDVVNGLISGLNSRLSRLREIASNIGSVVESAVKSTLGIQSPSKVMMDVGADTMEGFRLGLRDSVPDLRSELQGIAGLAPSFALPGTEKLSLPGAEVGTPTVQVFLGNQLLNQHVDSRIVQANETRDRLFVQGVRR